MDKNSEDSLPEIEASPTDSSDERLYNWFLDVEKEIIKTFEDAARQLIGLITALLGLFFGVLAFGDNPPFLSFLEIKILGVLSSCAFLAALFAALWVICPQKIDIPLSNLTRMRQIRKEIYDRKSRNLKISLIIFAFGVICLLGVIIRLLIG